MAKQNITREQLVNLISRLAYSQFEWNDCIADEDRGPDNKALAIVIYDDGSGFLADYQRSDFYEVTPAPSPMHWVNRQREFSNAEEAADVLIEMHQALDMSE